MGNNKENQKMNENTHKLVGEKLVNYAIPPWGQIKQIIVENILANDCIVLSTRHGSILYKERVFKGKNVVLSIPFYDLLDVSFLERLHISFEGDGNYDVEVVYDFETKYFDSYCVDDSRYDSRYVKREYIIIDTVDGRITNKYYEENQEIQKV